MADLTSPFAAALTLLWAPTGLIIAAYLGLLQFKTFYALFATLAARRRGGMLWRKVQPSLARFSSSLENTFGSPQKFTPSVTHVVLVAVILAVLIAAERIRGAVQRRARS